MPKIIKLIEKSDVEATILNGLSALVGDEKAIDAWNKLTEWTCSVNCRATGRTGLCQYSQRNIEVSSVLLKEQHAAKLRNTTLHEVAHAVNPILFGRGDHHGPQWRRIMRAFGEPADRCNTDEDVSADLRKRKMAKAKQIWACEHCEVELPILKRRKAPAESYTHLKCGGKFYVKRDIVGTTYPNPRRQAA